MKKDEKNIEHQQSIEEVAQEALDMIIRTLRAKAVTSPLDDDEVKSLSQAVDSLLKIKRDERELAEKYRNMSDDELIKEAKKAARVLKKHKPVKTVN